MKRLLLSVITLGMVMMSKAQVLTFKSTDLEVGISPTGYYSSIKAAGQDILGRNNCALMTACTGGKLITPKKINSAGNMLTLTMADGNKVTLQIAETVNCITLEVVSVPDSYDAVLFGPLKVNIHEVVGDVVGVVQGRGVAFGMQSMNIKTNAGIPTEYVDAAQNVYYGKGNSAELSVGSIPTYCLAAVDVSDGAVFQLSCRNRSRLMKREVVHLKDMTVLPVKGPDAFIKGAKIAIFGCQADKALARIGNIEVEQGLPHPLFDGEWGKTARAAMRSYLISDFSEKDFDLILDKAKKAGFRYVYQSGPFDSWGHFTWDKSFVANGDEGVKALVDRAARDGIKVGVHTLTNFTTTNDAYVTPIPSSHLLKQGPLTLLRDLDASQTEIRVKKSDLFTLAMTLNGLMIDKELITYGKATDEGDVTVLSNCKRGAFGTTATAHSKKSILYKLWDYPYKTFFPDLELQDNYSARLAEIFNKTGLAQISFDGLEGCMYTGQDDYATARFVNDFYKKVNHNVLNDASNLNHFLWHIHSRMNWGEPWGEEMRTGQVENRIKNQIFFRRNLFPRMLGWFLIRLADNKFECTSLEDLEWALSESAGFDAGYAMTINVKTLQRHGQIDRLLDAIKNWDMLREHQCFTESQMQKLKDPKTEWHLVKKDAQTFMLYPMNITKRYHCSFAEMQPGQSGGSDWVVSNPYASQFAFRLKVEGDGTIKNPSFTTDGGVISFPCTISSGQYLLFDSAGNAMVTDKNYNTITTVNAVGKAILPVGDSHIAFACDKQGDDNPEVIVRFITYGTPETIVFHQ
jgi:hypothetical protein